MAGGAGPALRADAAQRRRFSGDQPGARQDGAGLDGQDLPRRAPAARAALNAERGQAARDLRPVRAGGRRMKHARFVAEGRIYDGTVHADGRLAVAGGKFFAPEQVTWLPPVAVSGKAIGLALNYQD